ncbi:MAG: exonuclease SbcCD subunit D C-terminal domain-containing protein [Prevotellaceae bacterium]|jgi:exonuclease SbcD|nr:exonuclease SbcCD subunit D C-terminal domain-containing protein [Prevotellaceae bacterium]
MLTVFHTADWHIGQNFYGYDRKDEHLFFFEWLKQQTKELCPDVLLIAGDIFDSPNPSAESQKIYYRFLREISSENRGLQIIIVAGNHDSAARLEAPNPLLEEMNITVKGVIKRTPDGAIDCRDLLIPIAKGGEIVAWCIAVPYLRQGDYPPAENHVEGIELMYRELYAELEKIRMPAQAIIVTGHLQAKDAQLSDKDRSERAIIGGLECVPANIFDCNDTGYVALGHLHRHQTVAGHENIQYAGSPLPMSFAEKNYRQGINLVKFNKNMIDTVDRIHFEPPVGLLSLPFEPKPLNEVLLEIGKLPDGEITAHSPYLEIKMLITEPQPSIRFHIENALKGKSVKLACIVSQRLYSEEKNTKTTGYNDLQEMDPVEIAKIAFRSQYNYDMPENLENLLQSVIREVNSYN